MAILKIHTYPDPVLKKISKPVASIGEEVQQLLQDMAETMYASNGVGLAAPQVGRNLRVIVVHARRDEQEDRLYKLINPKIIEKETTIESDEGCLSLPELIVKVERFEKVRVEALQPDGQPVTIDADGLLSIALQHEIDHLDGILLVDRLSSLRRNLYCKKRTREEEKAAN